MNRFALSIVLPALALSLAACGAEPTSSPPDTATTPVEVPTAAPQAPPAPPVVGTDPGERIPAFMAKGTTGEAMHTVNSQEPGAVTVYCAGSTNCPVTNKYAERMKELETAYSAKGVQFIWLYPNRTEADAKKSKWHEDKGLAGTFVIDRDATIVKALDIKRTPEIVVTAADGKIAYRGAIDDGKGDPEEAKVPWLANALDAMLAGQPVRMEKTVPAG